MATYNSERLSDRLGGCDASQLALQFGTPLLVLDETALRSRMRAFRKAFSQPGWTSCVSYAGKALFVGSIAALAHEEGLALDVCSLGELVTALRAGVPAKRCILHGCYKTDEELDAAVDRRVGLTVIDHAPEIDALGRRARASGMRCDVLLRLNLGIAVDTHASVQTAAVASKFGFAVNDGQAQQAVRSAAAHDGLRLRGIHCHLGSQIRDLSVYEVEIDALLDFAQACYRDDGITFDIIDIGGGLAAGDGAGPEPEPQAWAAVVFAAFERRLAQASMPRPRIYVEPGRSLVADAGTTLYRIGVRKTLPDGSRALIVDGGLSDNPRPALYEARYRISVLGKEQLAPDAEYDVFGRHCESDLLFPRVPLADPQPGDLLAAAATGAYTYAMASNYNRFARHAVVLANDGKARLIARREPLDHVLDLDVAQ